MSTYKELLEQRAALEAQIAEARKAEVAAAVATVRQLVADFGLTADDVFQTPRARSAGTKGSTVAPKYRDPATGAVWTGRGKPPTWIKDKDREQFLIA